MADSTPTLADYLHYLGVSLPASRRPPDDVTYGPFGERYEVEQWQPPTMMGVDPVAVSLALVTRGKGGTPMPQRPPPQPYATPPAWKRPDAPYAPSLPRWLVEATYPGLGRPPQTLAEFLSLMARQGPVLGGAALAGDRAQALIDRWRQPPNDGIPTVPGAPY